MAFLCFILWYIYGRVYLGPPPLIERGHRPYLESRQHFILAAELPLTEAGNIFVSFRHKTSNFPLSFRWKWRQGGERGPERLFLELYIGHRKWKISKTLFEVTVLSLFLISDMAMEKTMYGG